MTTEELVNMDSVAFAAAVENLDAETCGRCARDLFHRLGGAGAFEEYYADVIRVMMWPAGSGEDRLVELHEVAKRYIPGGGGYGVLGRLTALAVHLIGLSLPLQSDRR